MPHRMARCRECGSENAPGFRFCGSCGTPVAGGCPSCGFDNPPGQRFCGGCGTRLVAGTVEPEDHRGERRLATVLFADVVGFTSLAEVSDPEVVAATVDEAMRRLAQIVVSHGGTVDKFIGDGVMALFGIPTAHGDDAARAVAAALAMRGQGGSLRFSIGVNSGEVMAAPVGDDGELTAIGDAVNVAARLEETAAAGEILIGALTAELVAGRFVLRAREPALLKGKREPVPVYEVLEERARPELELAASPPLVDREADLNFLVSCWRRAASQSRAQVVLLTGDAGVGKSRIAGELAAVAADDGLVVRSAAPGYGSLVSARIGMELARGLLGFDAEAGGKPPTVLDEAGVLRLRLMLAERAEHAPVLIVIEDLHNASRADLEPLTQLAARAADLPLLLLLAGRAQPAEWLGVFAGATTLRLEPLALDDACRLAASLSGELPLAEDAARQIAVEAGGNPLHVRELMRLLSTSRALVVRSGEYRIAERIPLPPSLHGVLSARLDALAPIEKAVVQDVAVFSDGARADEVAVLAGHDVSVTLERLVTSGLIRQDRSGRYVLNDPLLREVAYEQLPHASRGQRHRKAAAVAATPLGRARHLGLAAAFLSADAPLRDEASESLAATGLLLIDGPDFRGGIELLRQAVALGHADAKTLIRLVQAETDLGNLTEAGLLLDRIDPGGDPRLEAAVLHARGNWLHPDPATSLSMLSEAAERWGELGDERQRAWALANRGSLLFQLGRPEEAIAEFDQALEIFKAAGDRSGAAAAAQQLSLVKPEDPRVPALLAEGLALAEEAGDLVKVRNALIPLAWGRFIRNGLGGGESNAEALAAADRLAQISGEIGDVIFEVQARCIAAVLHRLVGRIDAAEDQIRQARRAAFTRASTQFPLLEAAAFVVAMARSGDPAARPAPATDAGPIAVVADALIIQALLLAGFTDQALEHLAASPLDVGSAGSPALGRLIGMSRGAALLFSNRHEESVETLQAAREAAMAVGARPTEVSAIALLAECHCLEGRMAEARELIAEAPGNPGGIAGLLLDRVRWLLGENELEAHVRETAAELLAPGLLMDLTPAAT